MGLIKQMDFRVRCQVLKGSAGSEHLEESCCEEPGSVGRITEDFCPQKPDPWSQNKHSDQAQGGKQTVLPLGISVKQEGSKPAVLKDQSREGTKVTVHGLPE